jgi:hypothetical protein
MNANSTPRELECKSLPHCVNSRINICRRIWWYHSNAYNFWSFLRARLFRWWDDSFSYLFSAWFEMWLQLFFTWKYIKIIFFYFLKIIFDINTSKLFKNTKNINLKQKNKNKFFLIFFKNAFKTQKQTENLTVNNIFKLVYTSIKIMFFF